MSALDNVNVARLISHLKRSLERVKNYKAVPMDLQQAAEQLVAPYKGVGPLVIGTPQVLAKWKMFASGPLGYKTKQGWCSSLRFYDAHGEKVECTIPRLKSRRRLRVWAKRQIGTCIVNVILKPVMPVEYINLNITIPKDEPEHPVLRSEEDHPVQGRPV